jgi:hypothetical protein
MSGPWRWGAVIVMVAMHGSSCAGTPKAALPSPSMLPAQAPPPGQPTGADADQEVVPPHADNRLGDRFFFGSRAGGTDAAAQQLMLGYETTFWPNDYFAIGVAVDISSSRADLSIPIVAAVPLRYVQIYAGIAPGSRAIDPIAGANLYASRNLRLFLQWEPWLWRNDEQLVVFGARWSPDAFHRARNINKVDLVWGSTLLTLAAWGIAHLAQ